jgi:hypothetical protein
MGRGDDMSIRYIQPAPNPYANAFGLLGMILGNNAAQRQGVKDNQAAIQAEYGSPYTGLLGGAQPNYTDPGQQNPAQATSDAPPIQTMTPAQVQTTTAAQAPTWADKRKELNQGMAQRLQEAARTMSPDAFNKMRGEFRAQYQQDVTDARAAFDKEEQARAWTAFETAPDYKSKLMTGVKAGLNPGLMKMALDTGKRIDKLNLNDKILPIIIDDQNQTITNAITGKPVSQEELQMGISAAQQAQMDLTARGQDITAANTAATRDSNQGKYVDIPGLGRVTTNEYLGRLETARPKKKEVIDIMGNKTTVDEGNPEVYALLKSLMPGAGGQPQAQPQPATKFPRTGNQRIDMLIDAAEAKNIPPEQIAEAVKNELAKGTQQPQYQSTPTTNLPGYYTD